MKSLVSDLAIAGICLTTLPEPPPGRQIRDDIPAHIIDFFDFELNCDFSPRLRCRLCESTSYCFVARDCLIFCVLSHTLPEGVRRLYGEERHGVF